jgi:hypothetical protein
VKEKITHLIRLRTEPPARCRSTHSRSAQASEVGGDATKREKRRASAARKRRVGSMTVAWSFCDRALGEFYDRAAWLSGSVTVAWRFYDRVRGLRIPWTGNFGSPAPGVGVLRASPLVLPKHPTPSGFWKGPHKLFDSLGWRVPTGAPQACHLHPQEDKTK